LTADSFDYGMALIITYLQAPKSVFWPVNSSCIVNKIVSTAFKKSFFITLAYVGSGTVAVMCLGLSGNSGEIISGLMTIILLLTIPVTWISFAIMYSDAHAYSTVLVVQSIMFLLFWAVLFLIINKRLKKNLLKANPTNK